MNWQDELRKLDEELASGRVSADEYRTRRDQVLASAHSVPPLQPQWQANPPSAPVQPGQPGQPASPDSATQYLRPVVPDAAQPGKENNPDATQVVSGGRQSPPPQDADRTQFVPGAGMAPQYGQPSPPHGFAQQPPPPPWSSTDTSAPWSTASPDSWLRQGPEVFDDTSSGGGKKVLAIVGIVLVVALIGGAVWFFGIRDSGRQAGGGTTDTSTSSPAPTTTTTKPPIDLLPVPPGTPNPNNGVVEVAQAVEAKLLSAEETAALDAAGVTEVNYKGSTEAAFTYEAMVFEAEDETKAEDLAAALGELQAKAGMVDGAKGRMPQKSSVQQLIRKNEPGTYRCLYVTGNKVVRITTVQTPIGVDDKELIKKFQEFGGTVVKQFPIS